MLVAVELTIDRRISDPEIGAEIDDPRAKAQKRRGELARHAVGQSEEDHFGGGGKLIRGRIAEPNRVSRRMQGRARENFRDALARKLSGGYRSQFRLRMTQKEPDQLFARVTGRAHHRHPGFLPRFHRAQCVFRLAKIATSSVAASLCEALERRRAWDASHRDAATEAASPSRHAK